MNKLYTIAYLKNTLAILIDNAKDLSAWDAYNDDILDEELIKLNDAIFLLSKKAEELA